MCKKAKIQSFETIKRQYHRNLFKNDKILIDSRIISRKKSLQKLTQRLNPICTVTKQSVGGGKVIVIPTQNQIWA